MNISVLTYCAHTDPCKAPNELSDYLQERRMEAGNMGWRACSAVKAKFHYASWFGGDLT